MSRKSRVRKGIGSDEEALIKEAFKDLFEFANASHRLLPSLSVHLSDNSKGPSFMARLTEQNPALAGELAIILVSWLDHGQRLADTLAIKERQFLVKFSGDKRHLQ